MSAATANAKKAVPGSVNPRAVTLALVLILFLSGLCLNLIAKSETTASPVEMIDDLARWFPGSKPTPVRDAATLPGYYALKTIGGWREIYLFDDFTYSFIIFTDIGALYDEGQWSLNDGVVEMKTTFSLDPRRKAGLISSLPTTGFSVGGKKQLLLLDGTFWSFLKSQADRSQGVTRDELVSIAAFGRSRDFGPDEPAALKQRFDETYGKHSFDAVWAKFNLCAAKCEKLSDGSFLLTSAEHFNQGYAAITVNGVKLQAHRIEISREMNVIRLSGAAEVVGGKLPDAPELTLYLEGKQILPSSPHR